MGDLKSEPLSDEEVTGLIDSETARLADAKNTDLSRESSVPFDSQHCTSSVSVGVANRGISVRESFSCIPMSSRYFGFAK